MPIYNLAYWSQNRPWISWTPQANSHLLQMTTYKVGWGGGWWQPWANTVAYWKLDGDMTDSSNNNRDMSVRVWSISYWTLTSWIKYWIFDGSTILTHSTNYAWLTSWTLLAWVYYNSVPWEWFADNQNTNNSNNYFSVWTYTNEYYRPLYWWVARWTTTAPWTWQWFLFAITQAESPATLHYYKNWALVSDISTWAFLYNSWHNQRCIWWLARWTQYYDKLTWYLSNIIIEDKVRTVQEISDYYDQTKWDYWIS